MTQKQPLMSISRRWRMRFKQLELLRIFSEALFAFYGQNKHFENSSNIFIVNKKIPQRNGVKYEV